MDLSSIFYVFARAAGGPTPDGIRKMWSKSTLRKCFLYMGAGRLISLPGFFSKAKMEEECFAPCKRSKNTQAAREGRTHEPETPPEVPGDGPVARKSVFRKISPEVIWELRNGLEFTPGELPDDPGSTLDVSENLRF